MKRTLGLLAILTISTFCFGEDLQLRQQAIRMLERANAVSTPAALPNLERTVTFRVFDANTGPTEGTFTRVVVQGTGRRDETTLGSYHIINVWAGGHLATTRTAELAPPPVENVMWLTPIYLVRFDHEDIIEGIDAQEVNGRAAHCIEFETVAGEKRDSNELCMDDANGTLLYEKLMNEEIENSNFFPFAGELFPGKISYSVDGIPKLDITQTMDVLTEVTPNVLAAPPNAQIRTYCRTYRRAFGQNMPQPAAGSGREDTDLVLRGIIGPDGRVHDAVVQSSDRPDLDAEALRTIGQWVFTPAMCDGKPNATEASFTLHFQGR